LEDFNLFKDLYDVSLGLPLGPRFKQDNVWQRNFSGGKVLVNPSTKIYTITLDKQYKKLDGTKVTNFNLGAHEGLILLNDRTLTVPQKLRIEVSED
jgi:hypothetical protein